MGWFFVVAVITTLIIAFYLGFRSINLFNSHQQGYFKGISRKLFWLILLTGSLSFIGSRAFYTVSDYWLPLIGNIVFSLILCFFYSILVIDLIRFIRWFILRKANNSGYVLQLTFVILGMVLFVGGLYMASSPRIVHYQINIDKPAKVKHLKIVQLTDIHINETTSNHFISNMVEQVNDLKPDYIFITGDTLDLRLEPFVNKQFASIFAQLEPKFGTVIIFGNHEHYGIEREPNNSNQSVIDAFEAGNMKVLQDDVIYDSNSGIYIIGRDDFIVRNFGKTRASLSELMQQIDVNQPTILLDHQPQDLVEPAKLGIDVMYSGHTHAGQIFPMTLVVDSMYQNPWGRYTSPNGHFTSIVSSGYGLWGPPIRLMTRAEIVVTELNFK